MDLSEEAWSALNADFHDAFRKSTGNQGYKSRDEISEGKGFEVLRKLRKVTGEFQIAAKAANDAVVRIIYDNKDPLPQATSNACEEKQDQSISLHCSPPENRELRPQREKKAPNKLR